MADDAETVFHHQFIHLMVRTPDGEKVVSSNRFESAEIRRELAEIKRVFGTDQTLDLPWFACRATDIIASWTSAG